MECEKCKKKLTPCWEFQDTWWCGDCQVYWVGIATDYETEVEPDILEAVQMISGGLSGIYRDLGGS